MWNPIAALERFLRRVAARQREKNYIRGAEWAAFEIERGVPINTVLRFINVHGDESAFDQGAREYCRLLKEFGHASPQQQ